MTDAQTEALHAILREAGATNSAAAKAVRAIAALTPEPAALPSGIDWEAEYHGAEAVLTEIRTAMNGSGHWKLGDELVSSIRALIDRPAALPAEVTYAQIDAINSRYYGDDEPEMRPTYREVARAMIALATPIAAPAAEAIGQPAHYTPEEWAVGAWLSAALNDDETDASFRADIEAWMRSIEGRAAKPDGWPDYIAGIIETYLESKPTPGEKRTTGIGNIIRRRMWLAAPAQPDAADPTDAEMEQIADAIWGAQKKRLPMSAAIQFAREVLRRAAPAQPAPEPAAEPEHVFMCLRQAEGEPRCGEWCKSDDCPASEPAADAGEVERDARRYRCIRNAPYSDHHGDLYAMSFQGDGDVVLKGAELDAAADAAIESIDRRAGS